jgi:EAL and modified HD-GYP domain-containing signal transduction protein
MGNHAYIGRQPVIDRKQRVIGYELLYRHSAEATEAMISDEFEACANVVANTLSNMGTEWLLGNGLAFINVTPALLNSEILSLLPSDRIVLELEFDAEEIKSADLLCLLRQARSKGFLVGLENVLPNRNTRPLVEIADYIKLDIQQFDDKALAKAVGQYHEFQPKLIAKKVETMKQFLACAELDFPYFQGFHFARPETLSVKTINPAHATVLELLNKVRANADVSEIETTFKQNMALALKLLRYINSVGFGVNVHIQSIRHALTILGYRQLYRWLTLLLITANNGSPSPALIQTAMTRGRFTELLGQKYLEGSERVNLFIVGIFSMLDVILEMPMDAVLETLNLPENIVDALLHREGVFAPFLKLAEASERMDLKCIAEIAQTLALPAEEVNRAQFEALAWAERLNS